MIDTFRMAAKAFIVNDNEDVLILKESSDYGEGTNPGKWLIPGGRIEPGESYDEALKREIDEETGLEVEIEDLITMGEWRPKINGDQFQITAVFFKCRAEDSEIRLSEEHIDYKWINPETHRDYNLIENIHEKFESFLRKQERFLGAGKAVVINQKGNILLLKRSANETHLENMWDVPGGSLEHGETPHESLRREVKEEAGIGIKVKDTVNTWSFIHDNNIHRFGATYVCDALNTEVSLSKEHSESRWVDVEDIDEMDIYDDLREGIKKAHRKWQKSNEFPKLVRDRIPEIITENNQRPRFRKASKDKEEKWLRKKILEEAREFEDEGDIEELADLYAVLKEYIEAEETEFSDLDAIENKKSGERGGFDERIILESVEK
jgi:mutator protein MutT